MNSTIYYSEQIVQSSRLRRKFQGHDKQYLLQLLCALLLFLAPKSHTFFILREMRVVNVRKDEELKYPTGLLRKHRYTTTQPLGLLAKEGGKQSNNIGIFMTEASTQAVGFVTNETQAFST